MGPLARSLRKLEKIDFSKNSLLGHNRAVKKAKTLKNEISKKIKKIIFSQRPCKWSKNVFRGERTLVRCFFFRSWIMVKVSHTLKNPLFWFLKSCIFAYFTLRVRPKTVFSSTMLAYISIKIKKLSKIQNFVRNLKNNLWAIRR